MKYNAGDRVEFMESAKVKVWLEAKYKRPSLNRGWHVVSTPNKNYHVLAGRLRPDQEPREYTRQGWRDAIANEGS